MSKINLPEDTDRGKTAYAAIVKAKSLEENASAAEREYIDALAQRYAPDGKMNDGLQLARMRTRCAELHARIPTTPTPARCSPSR